MACLAQMVSGGSLGTASYLDGGVASPGGLSIRLISKRSPVSDSLQAALRSPGGLTTSPAKMATLDYPPPPSPSHASRASTSTAPRDRSAVPQLGLGATTLAAAAAAPKDRRSSDNKENKLRSELWALRAEIEREKLRSVPAYPFFGRAMRFQDEFSALQITDDGRFSYSTVSFEASETSERASSVGRTTGRRVTTYEGVFVKATEVEGGEGGAVEHGHGHDEEKGERTSRGDQEVAAVEGKASFCHVIVEESGGSRNVLDSVQSGIFRFAITVSPFFQPTSATVQPLVPPRSPGRPPPRRRQLPYVGVGTGGGRLGGGGGGGGMGAMAPIGLASVMGLNGTVAAELKQSRRRGPRLKFSNSTTSLLPASQDATIFFAASLGGSAGGGGGGLGGQLAASLKTRTVQKLARGLAHSASAPQLPSLAGIMAGKDGAKKPTADDWKDYYRTRAQSMMKSVESGGGEYQ